MDKIVLSLEFDSFEEDKFKKGDVVKSVKYKRPNTYKMPITYVPTSLSNITKATVAAATILKYKDDIGYIISCKSKSKNVLKIGGPSSVSFYKDLKGINMIFFGESHTKYLSKCDIHIKDFFENIFNENKQVCYDIFIEGSLYTKKTKTNSNNSTLSQIRNITDFEYSQNNSLFKNFNWFSNIFNLFKDFNNVRYHWVDFRFNKGDILKKKPSYKDSETTELGFWWGDSDDDQILLINELKKNNIFSNNLFYYLIGGILRGKIDIVIDVKKSTIEALLDNYYEYDKHIQPEVYSEIDNIFKTFLPEKNYRSLVNSAYMCLKEFTRNNLNDVTITVEDSIEKAIQKFKINEINSLHTENSQSIQIDTIPNLTIDSSMKYQYNIQVSSRNNVTFKIKCPSWMTFTDNKNNTGTLSGTYDNYDKKLFLKTFLETLKETAHEKKKDLHYNLINCVHIDFYFLNRIFKKFYKETEICKDIKHVIFYGGDDHVINYEHFLKKYYFKKPIFRFPHNHTNEIRSYTEYFLEKNVCIPKQILVNISENLKWIKDKYNPNFDLT